jgi:hypothetical protein
MFVSVDRTPVSGEVDVREFRSHPALPSSRSLRRRRATASIAATEEGVEPSARRSVLADKAIKPRAA